MDPTQLKQEEPDHTLMLAVREGDLDRLGELFERHHRPLFGFFVRSTGRHAASEDLVQTVFMRILKYRHTYRDEGNIRTWMYHLARKCLADYFHAQSRHPSPVDDEFLAGVHDENDTDGARHAEKADHLSLLQTALAEMPEDQRELIVLHRFQQLSHEELASLHDCSEGAIKVRVHRALNHLKDIFHQLCQRGTQKGATS